MFNFVDIFILVKTGSSSFLSRIKKRKNLDKEFLNILKKQQISEKVKESYADFIIYNSSKNKVKLQVKNIIDKILLINDWSYFRYRDNGAFSRER